MNSASDWDDHGQATLSESARADVATTERLLQAMLGGHRRDFAPAPSASAAVGGSATIDTPPSVKFAQMRSGHSATTATAAGVDNDDDARPMKTVRDDGVAARSPPQPYGGFFLNRSDISHQHENRLGGSAFTSSPLGRTMILRADGRTGATASSPPVLGPAASTLWSRAPPPPQHQQAAPRLGEGARRFHCQFGGVNADNAVDPATRNDAIAAFVFRVNEAAAREWDHMTAAERTRYAATAAAHARYGGHHLTRVAAAPPSPHPQRQQPSPPNGTDVASPPLMNPNLARSHRTPPASNVVWGRLGATDPTSPPSAEHRVAPSNPGKRKSTPDHNAAAVAHTTGRSPRDNTAVGSRSDRSGGVVVSPPSNANNGNHNGGNVDYAPSTPLNAVEKHGVLCALDFALMYPEFKRLSPKEFFVKFGVHREDVHKLLVALAQSFENWQTIDFAATTDWACVHNTLREACIPRTWSIAPRSAYFGRASHRMLTELHERLLFEHATISRNRQVAAVLSPRGLPS